MKVTLINYTPFAAETLIFTKETRLNMDAARFEEIKNWEESKKLEHLQYMADTIPSSWEFIDYIFAIEGVSRAFTHQFVRTRTNSYAQQSMRVTNMEGFEFIAGPSLKDGSLADYVACMSHIADYYQAIIEQGGEVEDARGILPTNISTNIVAKINLRTLSDTAKSRSGGRTQKEYRDVVDSMIDQVLLVHPWSGFFLFPKGRNFFDEIEEFARQYKEQTGDSCVLKIIDKMRKAL